MAVLRTFFLDLKPEIFVSIVDFPPVKTPNDFRKTLKHSKSIRQVVRCESSFYEWLIIKNENQLDRLKKIISKQSCTTACDFPIILSTPKERFDWEILSMAQALQKLRYEKRNAVNV